jgi:tetratricopeptide (TPR) repeat protein
VWLLTRLVARGDKAEAALHREFLRSRRDSASPFDQAIIDWANACYEDSIAAQIASLNAAIEYSPGNAILLYSLARAKYLFQDYRACDSVLQPVMDRKWEFPSLYLLAAQSYDMLDDYDAERMALEQALALEYPPPEAHYYMATLHRRAGQLSQAQEQDNAFIRLMAEQGSSMRSIYAVLSDINIEEGFLDEGMDYYRRAIADRQESSQGHCTKGDTLCARSDTLHAILEYARALAVDSTNLFAAIHLARSYETVGLPRLAISFYRRSMRFDSASAEALYARSRIAILQQQL